MAITKCKECGNEVGTKVNSCPKCGAKIKKSIGCGGLILVFIALGIIVSIFSQSPNLTSRSPSVPSPTDIKNQVKEQVKIKKLKWYKGDFDNVMT